MIQQEEKIYLIVENSSTNLKLNQTGNDYILEGVFAEFGVENNNERIYEENEYLPHLDYLKEKIEKGNLFGEIDHPDRFEVKLDKVSHVVEDLVYNKSNRTIEGKIRLLSTPSGEIAKRLVDDGIQLNISSRSAGSVNEKTKKVKIQQIFAYDLVSEPGFAKASLHRVNESLGIFNKNVAIYDLNNLTEDTQISLEKNISKNNITKNRESSMSMDKLSKTPDNQILASHLAKLNEEILTIKNGLNTINVDTLKEDKKVLEKYLDSLTESVNNGLSEVEKETKASTSYAEYLGETLDKSIQHANHIVKNFERLIEQVETYSNKVDNLTAYQDHLCEKLNQTIAYTEYSSDFTNKSIEYLNYLAEKVNLGLNYNDYLSERLNLSLNYDDYLAEKIDQNIQFSEYVAEKVDQNINYSDHITSKVNEAFENINVVKEVSEIKKTIVEEQPELITENVITENVIVESISKENLVTKVDSIIESVQRKLQAEKDAVREFPYKSLLSENNLAKFNVAHQDIQMAVLNECKNRGIVNENQFLNIWKEYTEQSEPTDYRTTLLNCMPQYLKEAWNALTEAKQNAVLRQAEFYNHKNEKSMIEFWETRGVLCEKLDLLKDQKLNETKTYTKSVESNPFVDAVKSSLNRYKN